MMTVTLASTSTTRADILRQAGVAIEVVNPGVDEAALKHSLLADGATPREVADALAQAKAVKVSGKRRGLVIGADSTLDLAGRLFDKPADVQAAREHLLQFKGRSHALHSAVVIAEDGTPVWRHVASATLKVRDFSDAFLDRYLASEGDVVLSSVGCYRLEGLGAQLFTSIQGDYFAILGLPLLPVLEFLRIWGAIAP